MRKKLLAVDMDETCLNSKGILEEETVRWLWEAKEAGYEIVPTTGRPLSCVPPVFREGLAHYAVISNGAATVRLADDAVIHATPIDPSVAADLLRQADCPGMSLTAHIDREGYVQGRLSAWIGRLTYGPVADRVPVVRNLARYIEKKQCPVEEVQLFFLLPGRRKRAEEVLRRFPQLTAAYGRTYVEVFSYKTGKGKALRGLAHQLGVEDRDTVCLGDSLNDLDMFRWAHTRVAMGNAVPELKARATWVTGSNDEGGAAQAIRRLLRR